MVAYKFNTLYESSCHYGSNISATISFEPRHEKTNVLVSDLADINQAVQLQKIARGFKF